MTIPDGKISPTESRFRDSKCLLVASTGGHLAQLHRLALRWGVHSDSEWVTFDSPQSRSLLDGRVVHWVEYVPPRGILQAVRSSVLIHSLLKNSDVDFVISTGAAVAVSSHVAARLRNIPAVYIESVSRVEGPSLTGRIMEFVPGVEKVAQHQWGASRHGWSAPFSVLDTFQPARRGTDERRPLRSVFVTLGTIAPYEFGTLVTTLDSAMPPEVDVTWQIGCTTSYPSRGTVHSQMPTDQFLEQASSADLVVSHAGVGTLIQLIENGADVIAVPRLKKRAEHVDDHQQQIAREFSSRGLVEYVEIDNLAIAIKNRFDNS